MRNDLTSSAISVSNFTGDSASCKEANMNQDVSNIKATIFASSISGCFSRLLLFPIDTYKAQVQVQIELVDRMFRKEIFYYLLHPCGNNGLITFYRGIGISVLGSIPATCLYYTSYEYFKMLLTEMKSIGRYGYVLRDFVAGFLAEALSCFLWLPIDVTKERIQTQSILKFTQYNGNIDAMKRIISQEGIFGNLKEIVTLWDSSSITFLSTNKVLFCSMAAGAVAAFITTPLDLVKLRLQVQRRENKGLKSGFFYKSFFHGLYDIFKTEQTKGAFRGCGARVLFVTATYGITVTMMERLKKFYFTHIEGSAVCS